MVANQPRRIGRGVAAGGVAGFTCYRPAIDRTRLYRLMHAPPHLLFDRSQLRLHAIAPGLPFELEDTLAGFATDEGEAQEAKALRFTESALSAPVRRKATELDQSGFDRMKRQREPVLSVDPVGDV